MMRRLPSRRPDLDDPVKDKEAESESLSDVEGVEEIIETNESRVVNTSAFEPRLSKNEKRRSSAPTSR